jgi:hypothetical protein
MLGIDVGNDAVQFGIINVAYRIRPAAETDIAICLNHKK